jgi:hypothetical protein
MKSFAKLTLTLVFCCLFSACATSGLKYSEFKSTSVYMTPDNSRIYIYRATTLGAAVQPEVKVNGEVVGKAVPNGFFYVDGISGAYVISTSYKVERRLFLTLDKGQTRYVRLNIAKGFFVGYVYPELVEDEVAQKEIQDCRYTGK